jgi:hypothetical protein
MKHKDTLRREAIERLERTPTSSVRTRRERNGISETEDEVVARRNAEAARLREKFGKLIK